MVDRSLKALFATGLFADVNLSRVGNTLLVKVVENPIISSVDITGNTIIPTPEVLKALGVETGRVLNTVTMRNGLRAVEKDVGPLPPILLAAMRSRMVALAAEIADGAIWANGCRSHMAASLAVNSRGSSRILVGIRD